MKRKIEVKELVDELSAVIQAYIEEKDYYKDPVMAIGYDKDLIAIEIYESNKVVRLNDYEVYPLADLYVTDELRQELPNYEAIRKVAEKWATA